MNATELAHWRYRVKALLNSPQRIERIISDARARAASLRDYDRPTPENRNRWDEEVDDMKDELVLTRWLLEEARYMCELGELTRGAMSYGGQTSRPTGWHTFTRWVTEWIAADSLRTNPNDTSLTREIEQ